MSRLLGRHRHCNHSKSLTSIRAHVPQLYLCECSHTAPGTEPVSVLALTLGKAKLKMKETDGSGEEGCHRQIIPSPLINLSCHNVTMEEFAAGLKALAGEYVPKLVMDSTGLKGGWDFDLK